MDGYYSIPELTQEQRAATDAAMKQFMEFASELFHIIPTDMPGWTMIAPGPAPEGPIEPLKISAT